jgi:hypothetical protein
MPFHDEFRIQVASKIIDKMMKNYMSFVITLERGIESIGIYKEKNSREDE